MENTTATPGYIRVLKCKCPRCREGDMFQQKNPYRLNGFMRMYEFCPVCKQEFEIEVGFYYGAHYVAYALAIALSVSTFVAWFVIVGMSLKDDRFFYWMGFNAIALVLSQPYLQRLSRVVWLSFFVGYNKNWKTEPPKRGERVNKDLSNAW